MEKKNKVNLVHVNAFCKDCTWSSQDYKKGRKLAYNHSRSKNHRVHLEVAYAGVINPPNNI